MEPLTGTFHDAATGETIIRELTQEEIMLLPTQTPKPEEELVEGEQP